MVRQNCEQHKNDGQGGRQATIYYTDLPLRQQLCLGQVISWMSLASHYGTLCLGDTSMMASDGICIRRLADTARKVRMTIVVIDALEDEVEAEVPGIGFGGAGAGMLMRTRG